LSAAHGTKFHCRVDGFAPEFEGVSMGIELRSVDDIATRWVASLGGKVKDGAVETDWDPSLSGEMIVELFKVAIQRDFESQQPERSWEAPEQLAVGRCLLGRDGDVSVEELAGLAEELREQQHARYRHTFGAAGDENASEFEVICIVERLLLRTAMRLPGIELLPLNGGNEGRQEVHLINQLLSELDWVGGLDPKDWTQQSKAGRPWCLLRLPSIRAASPEEAIGIAQEVREETLHLLALNRGSSGQPVASLVRPAGQQQLSGASYEIRGYGGNLIGGFLSGEDQHDLVQQLEAIRNDPVLALATRLYREARAEDNPDFAYFRYWNLLELMAVARIDSSVEVTLLDGSPWPTQYSSAKHAVPRVYQLLKTRLTDQAETEIGMDLYATLRGWYARRNATAHYGAFDPSNPVQQRKSWFVRASATRQDASGNMTNGEPWLRGLRETVTLLVKRELHSYGAS